MDFRFTTDYPFSRLDEIVAYLAGPRLWIPKTDYPDFLDWANRSYEELRTETKRAMLALEGNDIAGITIFQRHKKYKEALEIKNLTVRPESRGRYIASFLLRNTEIEGAREFGSSLILCDAKSKNLSIRTFLFTNHYSAVQKGDIYGIEGGEDAVYRKRIYKI